MFSAILILLAMPFTDLSRNRGIQFRPLSKITFYIFVANFLVLMVLGAKHVESPFIELGQISTIIYFAHFLVIVPSVSLLENSLTELASYNSSKTTTTLSGLNFKPSSVLQMPMLETAVATGATATALSAAGAIKSLVPFVFALAVVVINVFYLVDFSGAELLALNELVNELKSLHEVAYGEYDRLAELVNLYERTNNPLLNETEAKFQEHLNLIKQIVSLIRKVELLIEPLDPGYEPFCAQW